MSVILSGTRVVMAAPGRPMLAASLGTATQSNPASGLAAVSGLAGWWDAGVAAGMLDASGSPLTASGAAVAAVADKSGNAQVLSVWHASSNGSAPVATPRLNGLLGGLGRSTVIPPALPTGSQQLPVMDPDQGLRSGSFSIGTGAAWTVFLVWSRPNWRQGSTTASPLLSINGTTVLAADNNGGTRLVLFPGTQQTVLSTILTRRHSHAVILRNTPGSGMDVWLDGTQLASGAPNPLGSSLNAPLLFLHNGGGQGGAECWFHEAAFWPLAVSAAGIATILSYQSRWYLGARRGIQILVCGQSNAGNGLNDGAWHLLAQGVAWHLGALAYGVVGTYGYPPSATCIGGQGIYPVPALGFPGSFLTNPGDGSDPSTWALGADGLAVQSYLANSTAAADANDIAVLFWPWSETDCTRQYSEKATYESAARRLLALERGMLSRRAASLPLVWWSAIPFAYGSNDPGMQMQREVVAEMAADGTQNVAVVLPQTADTLPRGAIQAADGTWSGGDSLHRDAVDNLRFGRLASPLVARAVLACGGGDTISALPAGVPMMGGPAVTHVYRQSNTTLVVTIAHDCGTDLIVPSPQGSAGLGWAVMDGGIAAMPGNIVTATACVRLNATQLQLTLATALTTASQYCRLFYPYGTTTIGRGNAVTDNRASVAPPTGWDITADLGADWGVNMPVHVPMSSPGGIGLSDTPT
ncbi:hypothetical protein [Rhodopila sp.]|jgi:hypothetical protein|uniref:hypothetical protein n=1 Tax=Rhodopila sp. TaxID=2480087 RepID=UPI002BF45F1F|nr:hypothetical protein [Rhodopila sp.]HVZ09690.1 hypothetical protein [Rhodopila sp.]